MYRVTMEYIEYIEFLGYMTTHPFSLERKGDGMATSPFYPKVGDGMVTSPF